MSSRHLSAPSLILGLALLATPSSSRADEVIPVGFDYLTTLPGTFFTVGGNPVPLMGNPSMLGPYGSDTIVQRLNSADIPDTIGQTATVSTVMTKLDLESVAPVNIGGSFFDVFVDLDLGHITNGNLTLMQTVNGEATVEGTFSSFFDVFFVLDLRPIGGGSDLVSHQELTLTGSGSLSDEPGSFFLQGQVQEGHPGAGLHIATEVPEPSSLVLFVITLAGSVLLFRKARRAHC
jgi:hypothetical protein